MAEKWRRCDKCRKVKSVDEFTGDLPRCQACEAPVAHRAPRGAGRVTTTRVAQPPAEAGAMVRTTAMRDLRGHGDPEVRARRAHIRALDRLAEQYADDFESLLAEERSAEGL